MRVPVVVVLLVSVVAACAGGSSPPVSGGDGCGGDDGDGHPAVDGSPPATADGGPPSAAPSGGYVKLERYTSGGETSLLALAELDSGHTGPGRLPATFYQSFPIDSCFQVPLLPEEPSSYDFVDVGAAIGLDGPATIDLTREILLGNIFYRARPDDILPGDYAVSLGAALRVPPPPQLLAPDISSGSAVIGPSIALSWEPVGADHLFAVLQQDSIGRVCHLADDGSFELPADAAAGVPAWGTLAFVALNVDTVDVGGRAVELLGIQGKVADYERP